MNTEKIVKTALIDTRISELKALLNVIKQQEPGDFVELIEQRINIYEQIKVMADDTNR